jgi:hypothetical protein
MKVAHYSSPCFDHQSTQHKINSPAGSYYQNFCLVFYYLYWPDRPVDNENQCSYLIRISRTTHFGFRHLATSQSAQHQASTWQVQNLLAHRRAHLRLLQSISLIPGKIIEHRQVDYQIQNKERYLRRRGIRVGLLDTAVAGLKVERGTELKRRRTGL